jgi:hypothetical protein
VCDYRRYGLDFEFIDTLYTPLGTTGSYRAIANLHTLQFTTAPAKPFPACCVLTSRSLATASNRGHSSASRVQFLLSQPPVQKSCQSLNPKCQLPIANNLSSNLLQSLLSYQLSRPGGARYIVSGWTQQKTPFFYCCMYVRFRGSVFTARCQETIFCWLTYCIATTVHATLIYCYCLPQWILQTAILKSVFIA